MTTTKNNEFSISVMLVAGLLVAVGLIYLFVFSMAEDGFGKNMERVKQQDEGAIASRIKPVVTLTDITGAGGDEAAAAPVAAAKSPRDLYAGACLACHDAGVAGAPKLGDTAAWEPRLANGFDALVSSAQAGKGAMPPNGGSAYSDDELRSVIQFMLSEAGLMDAPTAAAPATAEETPVTEATGSSEENFIQEQMGMDLAAGEKAYRGACFACHDTGAAGAPMLGDRAAWSPRLGAGYDAMLASAINGKGAMPPKGGAAYLSDGEVGNIVAFMMDRAK